MGARTIVNGRRLRPQRRGHRWYQPDLNIERDRAYLIGRGFAFAVIARGDRRVKVVSAHSTRALAESAAKAFGRKNPPEATVNDTHRLLKARARRSHLIETYVETQLAPTLKPGDIVVLDNLPAHKSAAAEKAIRAKDAWL